MDDKARTRMVQFCFLGMCLWNLVVSLDSTALSVALPVSIQRTSPYLPTLNGRRLDHSI